ncbi:MAG TPA: ABC transporter permease subunit [Candidatus Nanopelagicaceae bacterium]|nr:ABC transporter permease subunit [Candidatus Nanopelagicaceae bacterium]
MIWALVTKTWRDHWKSTISWTVGLFSMVAIELIVYPTIKRAGAGMSQLIESMPASFKSVFRMNDYTSGPGFLGAELFSMMVPLIFIAVGAAAGARATAEEESSGTADILLALPVTRAKIVLSKTFAALAVIFGLTVVLILSLVVGVRMAGLVITNSGLIGASIQTALLGVLFTGVALLIGALTGRKSIALGISIALSIAMFILYSLAPLVNSIGRTVWLNPFQWAIGGEPLLTGLSFGHTITLTVVSAALIFFAVLAFNRRDISS